MSFVSLGGDSSTRPTFFEISAADSLMPSLKAATIYSLSVFAQRRHYLHRLLAYEDELAALIAWVLDRQSLSSGSASFSDGLYGLRRATYTKDDSSGGNDSLSTGQQRLALLQLVGLPYLQAKMHKLYERHASEATSSSSFLASLTSRRQGPEGVGLQARAQAHLNLLRRLALALFLKAYPLTNSLAEGLTFCYNMLYLVDRSPYYSPVLHLLRQHIVRVSGQELASSERQKNASRRVQLRRTGQGLWLVSYLRQLSMKAGHMFADHTRNALILAVFAFKLLEWWYTSAEQKLALQKNLAVPPPPPMLGPHPDGVVLPRNPNTCPLCRQKRTNPAMAVPSGYVFCYPCLFAHVSRYGCCPVTRQPTNVDQIRKLYQSQ